MDKEGVAQQKAKSAKISYKIKIFAIHLTNLTLSFIIKYGYYYSLSRLIGGFFVIKFYCNGKRRKYNTHRRWHH